MSNESTRSQSLCLFNIKKTQISILSTFQKHNNISHLYRVYNIYKKKNIDLYTA